MGVIMLRKLGFSTPFLMVAVLAMAPLVPNTFDHAVGYPDRAARVDDCLSEGLQSSGIDREVFDPAHDVPTDVLSPDGQRACTFVPLGGAPSGAKAGT
jgi:hypothetical protein